jgi:hypothetical protein
MTYAKEYVQQCVDMANEFRQANVKLKGGVVYPQDLLLKYGLEWTQRVNPTPKRYRGPLNQCYKNAYKAMVRSKGALRYCEGVAYAGLIPTEHAWCIDSLGYVVETTWCDSRLADDSNKFEYFGIIFDNPDELHQYQALTGVFSVFAYWSWDKVLPLMLTNLNKRKEQNS